MYKTIPQIFAEVVTQYPAYTVQMSKDKNGVFQSISYSDLYSEVNSLAASLMNHGVKRGDLVGLISDNRREWLASDLAILSLGAADVPRGRDAMPYEVSFILSVTEASFCFVENAVQLRKILNISENLPALQHLIVMDREFTHQQRDEAASATKIEILCYQDLVDEGRALLDDHAIAKKVESERTKGNSEEIATIIFTSGTTGDPKGVMLTHANFAYQLEAVPKLIERFAPGQRWLSVLPVWHSFERIL
ncbi:MAG: AMP-binding protein, partial [Sphaerochaeta sp.]|nr:AMP-binding protein [Sphaerochaeta sp.]